MPRPPIDPPHHATGPVPHLQRPSRETIPHTTHDKAALYLLIAPHISALADDLWTLSLKSSGLAAEPPVIALAAKLLHEGRRLLRDEPGAALIGLDFAPPMLLHALALGMRQLSRAVAAFRERYYGHSPLTGGDAWAVCDAFGNPDARWLGPRPLTSLSGELDQLNLMTAGVIRTHLLRLADHTETKLPRHLRPAAAPPAPEPPGKPPLPLPHIRRARTRHRNRARRTDHQPG